MNTWIEKCIFPGAYPPSLREMTQILEPWEFSVSDIENLRLHYARTLMDWLERYEQRFDQITQMYDEPFARAWRLYLAGSIAAFTAGSLQLFQIVFARPDVNDLPWTRAYLYDK
jgi:cyclopropane-fatty-acyl-phospholipid synthase